MRQRALMMTLRELIRAKGYDVVATAMSTSVRRLRDVSSGRIALTVDDLYELQRSYGAFVDIAQTVVEIGSERDSAGVSRKYSPKRKGQK